MNQYQLAYFEDLVFEAATFGGAKPATHGHAGRARLLERLATHRPYAEAVIRAAMERADERIRRTRAAHPQMSFDFDGQGNVQ